MKLNKEALYYAMANAGVGQRELATSAGIGEVTITKGYSRAIRPQTAGKIAKALNVSVESIILREEA
jgi:DNA-binding Xre family transcriptional regulator